MGKSKNTGNQRLIAVFLLAGMFLSAAPLLHAGVLTLIKTEDKAIAAVGETVNYCIMANPEYVTPKADIVWIIDRSGSMAGPINNIVNNLIYFTEQMSGRQIDYRLGLISFVDGYYESFGFADNDDKFKSWLQIPTTGGIEPGLESLYMAHNEFPWRPDASKTLILVTDEPIPCAELGGSPLSMSLTAHDLFSKGYIIHTIGVAGEQIYYGKCDSRMLPPMAGGIWRDVLAPAEQWNSFLLALGEAVGTMNNFILRDPLPPQLSPVLSSLGSGTVDGNTVIWNFDEIDRGTPFEVCFNAVVTSPFAGQIANYAVGSADGITETSSNEVYLVMATFTVTTTKSHTNTPTATPTRTSTKTFTLTATGTITRTDTYTLTPSPTFTETGTFTPTVTGTVTETVTRTVTGTVTMSSTPTITVTYTLTPSFTRTVTPTVTVTLSVTYTETSAATGTPTGTVTPTVTITATPTKDTARYEIQAPASVPAGVPFYITVTAITSSIYGEVTADNYDGTARFGSSDPVRILPGDYTYIPGTDAGVHVFLVTLWTLGMQAITATDTAEPVITGLANVLVTPGQAVNFTINAPSTVMAGEIFYITVTAKDLYNNVVTDYTGTVGFTSTDSQWVSPGDVQFTPADNGVKILAVVMKTSGIQNIYCEDIIYPEINGTSNDINVLHGPLHNFLVSAPYTANSGVQFYYVVTARDEFNNIISDYTGTVHFTSTDAPGILPGDYAFQLSDAGSRIFEAALFTNGIQTISVNDTAVPASDGTSNNINVVTPAASYIRPLLLTSYLTQQNHYEFCYIRIDDRNYTFDANGDFLEYDVYVPEYSSNFYCSTEFQDGNYPGTVDDMRDFGQATQNYLRDQNGIRIHPSMDISAYAKGKWYHRKFDTGALQATGYYSNGYLSQDTGNIGYNGAPSNNPGTFNAFFDNITVKNSSGTVVWDVFSNTFTMKVGAGVVMSGMTAPSWRTDSTYPLDNYVWVVDGWKGWAAPASVPADGVSEALLTAYVWAPDIGANTKVAYALIDFKSNRPEDIIEPVTVSLNTKAITDWNGNAFARVRSTKTGAANITLSMGPFTRIVTVNFTAAPASKIVINPGVSNAQTGVSSTLNIKITDANGNFVPDGRTITVSSGSPTMQFSTDNGATWAGTAVFTGAVERSILARDSSENTAVVTAQAASLAQGQAIINVSNAQAVKLAVLPVNSAGTAGQPVMITVQAKDLSDANASSNAQVALTSASATMMFSSNLISWSQSITVNLAAGYSALYYRDTKAAANVTITASDTAALLAPGNGYATITAAAPALLSASADLYALPAGGSVTITARVTDLYGNPVAGRWVSFTPMVQGGKIQNASVNPAGNSTNASGEVTAVFTVSTDVSGSMNYCVVNTAGLLGTTVTISASATAGRLAFSPAPMSVGADKTGTLYINAKDANGYNSPAPAGHESTAVYANVTSVVFSLDGSAWYVSVTPTLNLSGAAMVYVKSHFTGTYYLTARDLNFDADHLIDGANTLNVTTGYYVKVVPDGALSADAGSAVTVTAQITDQNGNSVAMQGVHVRFSTDNGSISAFEAYTDVSGTASTVLTLSIISGVGHTVTAVIENPDDTGESGVITSVPVVSFSITSPSLAYRGVPFYITVRARDAYGITVDNYSNTITFSSVEPLASLPPDHYINALDGGVHIFPAILNTNGLWTITAGQVSDITVTGTSPNILVGDAPTATFTVTPTYTATPTFTPTVTLTATRTVTATVTETWTDTGTPTYSATPTATGTFTGTPTGTPTFTVTKTATETGTPTVTFTETPTETYTPTPTMTETVTETGTPSMTETITETRTDTFTPTVTETHTVSPTFTETLVATGTHTPTESPFISSTETATGTATETYTETDTKTETPAYSATGTPTYTPTRTVTPTPTVTETPILPDAYEVDDTYLQAKQIFAWDHQLHNISPAGNVDWLFFTVTASTMVTIETSGAAVDTEMWLYDPSGVASGTAIYYDDDGGYGATSKIQAMLNPGTYYIKIQDYGNNGIILEYYVDFVMAGPDAYEVDNTYDQANDIFSGVPQTHSIYQANDVDWVKFDVTTNSIVNIKTDGYDYADTVIYLYNSTGVPGTYLAYDNDGGAGYYSSITMQLTPGTYYVRVQENGQNSIIPSYFLELTITPATPTCTATPVTFDAFEVDDTYGAAKTIISGVTQLHNIHVVSDVDWVTFQVTSTSIVHIDTSGLAGDTVIYLYNSTGVPGTYIAMDDNNGIAYFSSITTTLAPGQYYVRVIENGQNALISAYYLDVRVDPITPTLTPTPVEGDAYEVDNTFPDAKEILPGTAQSHGIHNISDVDWVKFTLTQDAIITISTSGDLSDTVIYLYDSLGVPGTYIEFDDDDGPGLFSSITRQLTPGTYYVRVIEKGQNATIQQYDISFTAEFITPTMTPTQAVPDAYEVDDTHAAGTWIYDGMTQEHSIHVNSDVDWIRFTLADFSTVVVETSGPAGDTVMWLYNEAGVPTASIATDNDSGAGAFARISAMLPAGTYYVRIEENGMDAAIGQYFVTLDISQNTPTPTPTPTSPAGDAYEVDNTYPNAKTILSGVPQLHSLHVSGDHDWVRFDVPVTSLVTLETSGTSLDTYMYLYNSTGVVSGTYLTYDDDSGTGYCSLITLTLAPGTYYAMVREYSDSGLIPSYFLTLSITNSLTVTPTRTATRTQTKTHTPDVTNTDTPDVTPSMTYTPTITLNEAVDNFTLALLTNGNTVWSGGTAVYFSGNDAAQSGVLGNNMQTFISTTVTGPGSVSFYWKVSSEAVFDTLALYDGTVKVAEISGEIDWQQYVYVFATGTHNLRWEYAKNGSGSAGLDTAWLDMVEYTYMTATETPYASGTVTPTITPTGTATISLPEAVDNTTLTYLTFGAAEWYGQSLVSTAGGDAGQSGGAGNSQYSYMETNMAGPGSFNFYWKVSSQPGSDYLRLYIDGVLMESISGEVDWTYRSYTLGNGNHVIRWIYIKDASGAGGSDCGWVDSLVYIQNTMTITASWTPTRSVTPTRTVTGTYTMTRTVTETRTATMTFTDTPVVSATPTFTISETGTITKTPTITPTNMPWTASGLWHQVPDTAAPAGKAINSGSAWYYGIDATLTYNTGARNFGSLTSSDYYSLPAGAILHFQSWEQTENLSSYDTRNVYISANGGASWTLLQNFYGTENIWYDVNISLASYAGQTVRFRFDFDTIDGVANGYRGWYVDDITVTWPTPTVTRTVSRTGTPTSTRTVTLTGTPTYTRTATQTITGTPPSRTVTPSVTPTITGTPPTETPTPTATQTGTMTFTATRTDTSGPTFTVTPSVTVIPWTSAGLWHEVPDAAAPPGRAATSGNCWYYGQDATLNYETGTNANSGSITSPVYNNLAAGSYISFLSWEQTENSPSWDRRNIYISLNGGVTWTLLQNLYGTENTWYTVTISLSAYTGASVMFRFEFDTIDGYVNNYRGWYVDDIFIGTPTPAVTLTSTLSRTASPTVTPTITGTPPTETVTPTNTQYVTPVIPPGMGMVWQLVTDPAAFSARYGHTSVVFDNRMWVIGGLDNMGPASSVYSSIDGLNWVTETAAAAFPARGMHTSVVFDNRMWVIGGNGAAGYLNDVWSSVDGVNWVQETAAAPFDGRYWHTSGVFNGRIWVTGGMGNMGFYNDVWSSVDGINWVQETPAAAYSGRFGQSMAVHGGRMWIINGLDIMGTIMNDVWSSTDGINWTQETAFAPYNARYANTLLVYGGRMWMIAGYDDATGFVNDVWSSADGINWTQETAAANFTGRAAHSSVVFNSRLWVIGGYEAAGMVNDVWRSPPDSPPTPTVTRTGTPTATATAVICGVPGADWYAATQNASFNPRHMPVVLPFNNKMWIIGGASPVLHYSDVWSTVDGVSWSLENSSAAFGGRAGHAGVVFNNGTGDKMWIIAGSNSGTSRNDVWYSSDGINWTLATANAGFTPRWGLTAMVYNNRIWITGGNDGADKNDVWWTSDGANWFQATAAAAFPVRQYPVSAVYDDGSGEKMWVISGSSNSTNLNDVWWSVNGVNWNPAGNAAFQPRKCSNAYVYDGKMWVVSGLNATGLNDAWWTMNGTAWTSAVLAAPFTARRSSGSTVFNNRMWLAGGWINGANVVNDVWYSCGANTPTATPTGTRTGTATPVQSATPTMTATQSITPTGTPTNTRTATPTSTRTPTFTATATQTTVIVGLWHQVTDAAAPGGNVSVSPDAWYYGIDATLSYNTGARTYGDLVTAVYPNLAPGSFLTFRSWEETENSPSFDTRNVYISTDYGASWTLLSNLYGNETYWYTVSSDLSAYAGQDVIFRFEFDSVDDYGNDFRGWYVDDINVFAATPTATATATGTETPTFTATPTATQCVPGMLGSTNIAVNSLNANMLYASRFELLQNALVYRMHVYIAAGSGDVVAAIYSDSSGQPDAFITASVPQAIVTGWNDIDITAVSLPAGHYWLVFQAQGGGIAFGHTNTYAGAGAYVTNLFGTMPDPFGPPVITTRTYAVYADFCPDIGYLVTATATPTITGTVTQTDTPVYSPTSTGTSTATGTGTSTSTVTATATETFTITDTHTDTPVCSPTDTPTNTPTFTATGTVTETITGTPPTETATPTSTLCPEGTLGNNNTGLVNAVNAGNLYGSRFELLQGAMVYGMHLYINAGIGDAVVAVYSDLSGQPDAFITSSAPQTIVTGWNDFDITPVSLPAGNYWLVFQAQGSGINFRYINAYPGAGIYVPNLFGTMPDPLSSPAYTMRSFSVYADFCPDTGYIITATVTPTITETVTRTITPDYSATNTGTPTVSETITGTPPTETATPSASVSGTATETSTDTPYHSPTVTDTATETPTVTETSTDTPIHSPTVTPTVTETGTDTPIHSPTSSATASVSPSDTNTITPTSSVSDTPTITETITGTPPTETATPTNTTADTPDITQTVIAVLSATMTATMTETPTASETITGTPPTETATPSVTDTGTATETSTETPYHSPTVTATITETITGTPPTETATPTNTTTDTPDITQTVIAALSATMTATMTETPTASETITGTPPTETATPTVTETWTVTETPTVTETSTDTPVCSPTSTATGTETPTITRTDTPTGTPTGTATVTPTITGTPPTETATPSATRSSTRTPLNTRTWTPTRSPTATITETYTHTFTVTPTGTETATPTVTESSTPTATATGTGTGTATGTATQTFTETDTPTGTATCTPSVSPTMEIWTVDSLWHQVPDIAAPAGNVSLSPTAWYYGIDATLSYNTGARTYGSLLSPVYFNLAPNAALSFTSWAATENSPSVDQRRVFISIDGGLNWTLLSTLQGSELAWEQVTIGLGAGYAGQDAVFRFEFDSVDAYANDFRGWYIDGFTLIQATATASPTGTHTPTPTITPTVTCTWATFVNTPSCTPTPTPTPTATRMPQGPELFVLDALISPNPVNPAGGNIIVSYFLTQDVSGTRIKVFTNAFRKVKDIQISGPEQAGIRQHTISAANFADFANGSYYYFLETTGGNGKKARSDAAIMVLLK